jgi:ribosomal-protein-alanine N-acetyltransferase
MASFLQRLRAAFWKSPTPERLGPSALRIRRMAYRDLNTVGAMENTSFGSPWRVSAFARAMSDSNQWFVVAEMDHQLVGYAGFWPEHGRAHIAKLAVRTDYRRRGIGSALLQEMINQIRHIGCDEAFLEVRRSNSAAQEMYRRFGFHFERVQPNAYPNDGEDAFILARGDLLASKPAPPVPLPAED